LYLGAFFFGGESRQTTHPGSSSPPPAGQANHAHPLASRKARTASQPEDQPLHPSEIPSRRPGQAPIHWRAAKPGRPANPKTNRSTHLKSPLPPARPCL